MKFQNELEGVLGNTLRIRVLRVLARFPEKGFTGRELARACSVSPSQANVALEAPRDSGVVFREIAGRAHVWRLAREHLLCPVLVDLSRSEAALPKRLQRELERVLRALPVERAFLFGSVARGEGRPTSDLDLFVQVGSRSEKETVEDALSGASARFALRLGNPLSALVLDHAQMRHPTNPALIRRILSDGLELGR
ncbi:MAG TPA: nucleotidyltransferase domain-containing protein [Thermoplasmata archaeon]|nr:nucleotidyltransferase domain-containing protein [Thermoplasmata archaeon]